MGGQAHPSHVSASRGLSIECGLHIDPPASAPDAILTLRQKPCCSSAPPPWPKSSAATCPGCGKARQGKPAWLLLPAALSLGLFAWLLTLHATAAGRVYAAYGGVYIGVALAWLWAVDGVRPTAWDVAGVLVALAGMGIIMFQPGR